MEQTKKNLIEHAVVFTLFGIGIGLGLSSLYYLTGAKFSKTELAILLAAASILSTSTGIFGRSLSQKILTGDKREE